jgi:hypothetical protein
VIAGDRDSYRRLDDKYESAPAEALIDGELLGKDDGPAGRQRLARARENHDMQ